jgi:hypothetical protein
MRRGRRIIVLSDTVWWMLPDPYINRALRESRAARRAENWTPMPWIGRERRLCRV